MRTIATRICSYSVAAAALLGTWSLATDADARPNIQRKGGQWGVMLGGSACIPGKAECSRDAVSEGGITVDGDTRPSFGMNAELGYRFNKWVFAGASYNLGFFDTKYEFSNGTGTGQYKRAYQNSIYGVVRPTLPVWRFDFGLGMGPGFSRQVFVLDNGDRDYSQGFSWVFSPSIDIFVSRRIFVGVKMDLLLNAHTRSCRERGNQTTCLKTRETDLAPVHQTIVGLHVGGTFL